MASDLYSKSDEPIDSLAERGANTIHAAFLAYRAEFNAITRRARVRFEQRDWHGMQDDALERLDLYKKIVDGVVAETQAVLGEAVRQEAIWLRMKACYSRCIAGYGDFEIAETFFNSITRRIFATVGVDPGREYVDSDFNAPPARSSQPVYHTYPAAPTTSDLLRRMLSDYALAAAYADLDRDVALAAREIDQQLHAADLHSIETVDTLQAIFYRNTGAYIVGRIRSDGRIVPLLLALRHPPEGIVIDAVLMDENDVSIVFSYTRSYFHVEVEHPHETIEFLKSILPLKRVAELYISIGYNKHGKTELYRDLLRHLATSTDKFEIARGDKGMVMLVFDLPSYDVVFKIIKDQFAYPKTATRQEVMEKYALVFKHDKAGRLIDAQEYEHLEFERSRFSEELVAELLKTAANSVTVNEGCIAIKHLYAERRMTPLNLYIREMPEAAAREAITDYGQAVKDLASTNIFPGDMLLKNFGVTRHGRVVFYDYDELCLLTDCHFRELPESDDTDEELSADPWFYVGPNDIFPEEFIRFFGLPSQLREAFLQTHGDLLGVEFWTHMQDRHRAGEVVDIFSYKQSKRLRRET
ncbi:MAG TPA: bifunctional isocitrate dehydrogenase kinase/phosphatase [Anaerolineae bacterium]|nr:bifunctional isocitrate dehydrogenase kinase/phosphatase [Anaerolineae bacterium]